MPFPFKYIRRDLIAAFGTAAGFFFTAGWQIIEKVEFFGIFKPSQYGTRGFAFLIICSLLAGAILSIFITRAKQTKVTICVFDKVLPYLPLYLAMEAGFFKKRRIEVNIVVGLGDKKTWKEVSENRADFGLSDPVVSLHEDDREKNEGRLVATLVTKSTMCGITRKPLPFYHDFASIPKGLVFSGYEEPSTTHRALLKLKEKSGAIIITYKPGQEEIAAQDVDSDIVILNEPFATVWVDKYKGYHRVLDGAQFFGDLAWSGLYCTQPYIHNNSKTVQGVVDSLQEALDCIHTDPMLALRYAVDIYQDFEKTAVCSAVLSMIRQDVFPKNLVTSRLEWASALDLWGLKGEDLVFSRFVNNNFAGKSLKNRKP